jgi:hypothetical protein
MPKVTIIETEQFYKKPSKENICIILSSVPKYVKEYQPMEARYQLQKPPRGIFDHSYTTKKKEEISAECERLLKSLQMISYE